jgi:hypothetical protein
MNKQKFRNYKTRDCYATGFCNKANECANKDIECRDCIQVGKHYSHFLAIKREYNLALKTFTKVKKNK